MGEDTLEALFGRPLAIAGFVTEEVLWGVEEGPTPAVAVTVFVGGVDEIFGDHTAGHLEAGDVTVKARTHLGTVETAGTPQVPRNHVSIDT